MTDLVRIDIDELHRLRRNGQNFEAEQLLRAYRKSCNEQKQRDKQEATTIQHNKYVAYGICIMCTSRDARPKLLTCQHCADVYKTKYQRNKEAALSNHATK